jgi:hypothetical protein
MNALRKEELRLLKLLIQNLEAQLLQEPLYQKYMEAKALVAGLTEAPSTDCRGASAQP